MDCTGTMPDTPHYRVCISNTLAWHYILCNVMHAPVLSYKHPFFMLFTCFHSPHDTCTPLTTLVHTSTYSPINATHNDMFTSHARCAHHENELTPEHCPLVLTPPPNTCLPASTSTPTDATPDVTPMLYDPCQYIYIVHHTYCTPV